MENIEIINTANNNDNNNDEEEKKKKDEEKKQKNLQKLRELKKKQKEEKKKKKEKKEKDIEKLRTYPSFTWKERQEEARKARQFSSKIPPGLFELTTGDEGVKTRAQDKIIKENIEKYKDFEEISESINLNSDPEFPKEKEENEEELKKKLKKNEGKVAKRFKKRINELKKKYKEDMKSLKEELEDKRKSDIAWGCNNIKRIHPGNYPNATPEQIKEMNSLMDRVVDIANEEFDGEYKRLVAEYKKKLPLEAKAILNINNMAPDELKPFEPKKVTFKDLFHKDFESFKRKRMENIINSSEEESEDDKNKKIMKERDVDDADDDDALNKNKINF